MEALTAGCWDGTDPGNTGANGDDFYGTYASQLGGNSLWIEKIGGSPQLRTYFVDEVSSWNPSANGPYTPIFGTAGGSMKWRWDGLMDHNAYAVSLSDITSANQMFTATYHLYVGDANGVPVPGFGGTATTWTWDGPSVATVPEPSALALLSIGALMYLFMKNRIAPLRKALCALLAVTSAAAVDAATLTAVPMQGGMLMPMVCYHADSGNVTVDLSQISVTAQLTPLMISNPNDSFDPGDPWFKDLDPSRHGLAFSRRYGFDMDPNTDLLPSGQQIWIRKLAGSPDLSIYDYNASTTPRQWEPIFGTAGSSNATAWSGLMWHVGVAAPPGTNTYFATFEIYVFDTAAGAEVPGSSSGPFELNWTCVPDGRPQLSIAASPPNGVVLLWPARAINWLPVCAAEMTSTNWTLATTNAPVLLDGQCAIYVDSPLTNQFFRLQRNP